jgi:hypothetical protein
VCRDDPAFKIQGVKEMKNTCKNTNDPISVLFYAAVMVVAISCSTVSGHNIKGINYPTLATARITSPTSAVDVPIPIYNTGISVACFNVRNTSPYAPEITAVGLDLPGNYSDFSSVLPTGTTFRLENEAPMNPFLANLPPDGGPLMYSVRILDFAFLTVPRFNSNSGNGGLLSSSQFTTFCASGRFPAGMSIETMLNYVYVRFTHVGPAADLNDVGIWENASLP